MQNDFQNAYALSQIENQRVDPEIAKALAKGKFVVVAHVPVFCPRTDAAMGENQYCESEHEDFRAAERELIRLEDEAQAAQCDEIRYTVSLPEGATVTDVNEVTGDVDTWDPRTGEIVPETDTDIPF